MRMRRLLQFVRLVYRLRSYAAPGVYYRDVVVGNDFVDLRVAGRTSG